jgi:alpha(1,3/1,4) fucosyltransferase
MSSTNCPPPSADQTPRRCLVVSGWAGNSRLAEFRPDDDGRADFVLRLIEKLGEAGFMVSTEPEDFGRYDPPSFELHIEAQRTRAPTAPQYLLLIEDRHIRPQNYFVRWRKYRRVFSWDDDIVGTRGAMKYLFPAHISAGPVGDFADRSIFMSLVAANKGQAVRTRDDLYCERINSLVWFQRNAPNDLRLYGSGWNLPNHPHGLTAKVLFKIIRRTRVFKHHGRPCWQGVAPVKRDVLLRSKFNLCYENTRGAKGYISEKLFDALSSGAVPVYWGAPNITDYVPGNCFVDRREFATNEALFHYLKAITPQQHVRYQEAMREFCTTHAERFGIETFAKSIVDELITDLSRIQCVRQLPR